MKKISIIFGILCSLSLICAGGPLAAPPIDANLFDSHDSVDFAAKPKNVVIVAKEFGGVNVFDGVSSFPAGHGQYTSIGSALGSITPTSSIPML